MTAQATKTAAVASRWVRPELTRLGALDAVQNTGTGPTQRGANRS